MSDYPTSEAVAVIPQQRESAGDAMMRMAQDPTVDAAKLRELLAVRREWNADEAAQAFNAAVVRFQQRCPIIAKGDTADGKAYAAIDRIWRTVRPIMEDCGLAVTWESAKVQGGDGEHPTCILDGHLRHARGHAQPLHYELPIPKPITTRDGRQVQNVAQVMGSATTYAKRYATCAALGVQTGKDDDGACGMGGGAALDSKQVALIKELCRESGRGEATIAAVYGVQVVEGIPAAMFDAAVKMLEKAKAAKARPA